MTAIAYTSEDWPSLARVVKFGSTNSEVLKIATTAFGFFSTSSISCFTPASEVATLSGTTAPFSAMSGPVIVTSLLSVGVPAPTALSASATLLASKASLV